MNQGNHWPLGSRLLTTEEVTAQLAQTARSVEAFSMTFKATAPDISSVPDSNNPRSTKPAAPPGQNRPISWLGRP